MDPHAHEDSRDRATFIFLTMASSVLIASILTFHNIASVHRGNLDGFHFALRQIYYVSGPLFLVISALLTAPALVLWGKLLRLYAFTLFYLGGLVWVYSSFIVLDFGLLDGRPWEFSALDDYRNIEIAAFALTWFGLGFVTISRPKIVLYFAVFLNIALVVPTAYALMTDPKDASLEERGDLEAAFRFSRQHNTLIVLMDAFQSDIFADLATADPALSEALRGFAFFPDTAGVARSTSLTMPAIHSGTIYSPSDTIREFYDQEIRRGSFLNALATAGHDVTLINPIQRVCPARIGLCLDGEELLHGKWQMLLMETAYLLDLSLFRAVPLFAKKRVYNRQFWRIAPGVRSLSVVMGRQEHPVVESNRILEVLAERGLVAGDRPVVKFIHLLNTHRPYVLGPDCRVRGDIGEDTRAKATVQARCGMDVFLRLLDFLKKQAIYDRSLIFLIADTGAFLPSGYIAPEAGTANWRTLVGNANPLFLVKAPGARAAFREVPAGIQPSDIPATVCAYVAGCGFVPGVSVFDAEAAPPRTRFYRDYAWPNSYWGKDVTLESRNYAIQGPIWDRHSWTDF